MIPNNAVKQKWPRDILHPDYWVCWCSRNNVHIKTPPFDVCPVCGCNLLADIRPDATLLDIQEQTILRDIWDRRQVRLALNEPVYEGEDA